MDVVLDSGALTAWARSRPPADLLDLLEVAAQSGGAVILPTVTVVESTTGRQRDDARINQLLRRVVMDSCTLERSRQAAALRFSCLRSVSAVDAVVAATAAERTRATVVTSDPDDLQALLTNTVRAVPVLAV
ncbi:MAG: PIN domain-containing protein [Pseudonocardiaceae bacterium]